MAYDEGLAQRIREVLDDAESITEKKMFGGLAFLERGYMFVGIAGEAMMARIGPAAYTDALARPNVRPMDFTGRPMKGYVFIDPPGIERDADLVEWVVAARAFAGTLPKK